MRAVVVIQAPGFARYAVPRPGLQGGHERVGDGLLREVEVAAEEARMSVARTRPDSSRKVRSTRARTASADQPRGPGAGEVRHRMSTTGATSTEPYSGTGAARGGLEGGVEVGQSTM